MKSFSVVLIPLFILFLYAVDVFAFRCGTGLVSSGDSKMKVQVTCGKPTFKDSSCEGRQTTTTIDKKGNIKKQNKCSRKLEVWHYNCGENDYIYALTFEDGKMVGESTEGRGRGKSECRGK